MINSSDGLKDVETSIAFPFKRFILFIDIILKKVICEGGMELVKKNTPISEESLRITTPMLWYCGIEKPKSRTLFIELELISCEEKTQLIDGNNISLLRKLD